MDEWTVIASGGLRGARLLAFESLPSTNTWALEHAEACAPGDVVWARSQTAGRGRFDRQWFSSEEAGLTFSVLLAPDTVPLDLLPAAAALAVATVLERRAVHAGVQWPNDVLVDGKKICGILAEAASNGMLVLGIGLNVNATASEFEAMDLRHPATALSIETGTRSEIRPLLSELLGVLAALLELTVRDPSGIRDRWDTLDALAGRQVRVESAKDSAEGRYAGIDDDGCLRLRLPSGEIRTFSAGDVSLRP